MLKWKCCARFEISALPLADGHEVGRQFCRSSPPLNQHCEHLKRFILIYLKYTGIKTPEVGTGTYFQGCGCGSESGSGRIRTFLLGSGSYRYLGNVKLYTQGKSFKNKGFTHFQVNFSIFSDKNNLHSNIRRNMFDVKKILMFELILYVPVGSGIRF